VYNLYVLSDYVERTPSYQYDCTDIYQLLLYLETDEWMSSLLPSFVIPEDIIRKDKLYSYLQSKFSSIYSKIDKTKLPVLMAYFIEYTSSDDFCKMLYRLINKDIGLVLANQIMKEHENGNDQEVGKNSAS
jgi:hypothetical protein